MKGIKIGILGITVALAGIGFAMSNIISMSMGFIGVTLAVAALMVKD